MKWLRVMCPLRLPLVSLKRASLTHIPANKRQRIKPHIDQLYWRSVSLSSLVIGRHGCCCAHAYASVTRFACFCSCDGGIMVLSIGRRRADKRETGRIPGKIKFTTGDLVYGLTRTLCLQNCTYFTHGEIKR